MYRKPNQFQCSASNLFEQGPPEHPKQAKHRRSSIQVDFTMKTYSPGSSSTTATPSTTPSKPGEKRKSSRPPAGGPAVNNLDVHKFQVDLLLNAAPNNPDFHIYMIYPLNLIPNMVDLHPNAALNNLDFLTFQVDLLRNLVDLRPKLQLQHLVLLQKRRRYTRLTHKI